MERKFLLGPKGKEQEKVEGKPKALSIWGGALSLHRTSHTWRLSSLPTLLAQIKVKMGRLVWEMKGS